MPHQIKPADARAVLADIFPLAEEDYRESAAINVRDDIVRSTDRLFLPKKTEAYRQALVGCAVARILNPKIDIRYPATEEGPGSENSYSGRSLDEGAVMPFLRDRAVPVLDASAYLGPLRGGAKLIEGGEPRIQRDKAGYAALVVIVDYVRNLGEAQAREYLRFLLRRFVEIRERSKIALQRIGEPKLEQLARLIDGLLTIKSGGRIPAFITTAMFQTMSECHGLDWEVDFQGINVADKASGAVGDITVRKDGKILQGIEVTERPVSPSRVKLVFEQKISPGNVRDYLFVTTVAPEKGAPELARRYTAAGNEVNFVDLRKWVCHNLATIGPACRTIFQDKLIELFGAPGTPAELKVAWNERMDIALGVRD